jgi:CelD/BcsL family acetyltransferase involved in cellulose biosynthesis
MVNAHDVTANPIVGAPSTSRRLRVSAYLNADVTSAARTWGELEANPEVSFHQSQAWVKAWAGGTGTSLSIVTLEKDGKALAVLPLEIIRIGGLKLARFAGTAFSNANTGLVSEHTPTEKLSRPVNSLRR